MGIHKRFSTELFEESDSRARAAVQFHVQSSTGLHCRENPDKYGPDLQLYSGYRPAHYLEVEVKRVWKAGSQFPWTSVQVPERKGKFTRLGLPCDFWILREDLKFALVFSDEILSRSPLVEVPNKFNQSGGEFFYQVPIEECQLVELEVFGGE